METLGVYKNVTLTADPGPALAFAIIGWVIVLGIVFFCLYKWFYKKPGAAGK